MITFEELRKSFEKDFSIPFPDELLPPGGIASLKEVGQALVCSAQGKAQRYLIQGDINDFVDAAPAGAYLTGYWGHGANSYAHYIVLTDGWRRLFFRQFWGGAYGHPESDAAAIRDFLKRYVRFENIARGKVRELVLVNSMGRQEGYYRTLDGHKAVFPLNADNEIVFPEMI